ncbi:MAG: hypothetical protein WCG34_11395 [Leptolinea sp.]
MIKRLSPHRFEIVIVLIALISAIYVACAPSNNLMNWYSTDDAFYYFKTAQNVSEGHGLTFDRIGRASGFHPLWMMVCIPIFALARFNLMLPLRVLVLVAGLLNAGTGIFLYRMSRKVISEPAAIVTALLWLLTPSIQGVSSRLGMESTVSAFFIVFLFYLVSGYETAQGKTWQETLKKVLPIGLVAALTILSRLDNIFLVGMAGIWLVFRRSKLHGLLLADMATFYLAPVAAAFWRLKPGAEYYQYAESVYVALAVSILAKPVIFEYLGVYRKRGDIPLWSLIIRIFAGCLVAGLVTLGLLTGLTSAGIITGFPRTVPLVDVLLTFGAVFIIHLLDWFREHRRRLTLESPSLRNWDKWLPEGLGYGLPIAVLMGMYFIFNLFYFGTPAPVSGQIKQWWGSLPNTVYGLPNEVWEGFIGFPEKERGPWNPVQSLINTRIEDAAEAAGKTTFDEPYYSQKNFSWAVFFSFAGVLAFSYRKKISSTILKLALPALFLGCMCQIASYMGTSYVNTRPWYWVQEMVLLVLCGGVLFDGFLAFLSWVRVAKNLQQTVVVFFSLFLLYNYVTDLVSFVPYYVKPGRERLYLAGAEGLEKATPPGARIGSTGGGVVAYFIKDRTIINLDGLMNSIEYFHLLKEGRANEYLDAVGMEYLYGNQYMITDSDPYIGLFKNRVKFIQDVWGSGLYRYFPQ